MQPKTIKSLKEFLNRRSSDLSELEIAWFGGEPLIALDIVYEIQKYCFDLARDSNIRLVSGMTTNGYKLTRDNLEKLFSIGIKSYQVSLDGGKPWHDKYRKKMDGSGTFDIIWSNLKSLKYSSADFNILLRLHYTHENIEDVYNFCEVLSEEFFDDRRFTFFPKQICKLGGKNDQLIKPLSHSQSRAIEGKMLKILGIGMDSPDSTCKICYAGRANAFVLRSNGRINKCTVMLNHPCNDIGHLDDNGNIHIENKLHNKWLTGVIEDKPELMECPARAIEV